MEDNKINGEIQNNQVNPDNKYLNTHQMFIQNKIHNEEKNKVKKI